MIVWAYISLFVKFMCLCKFYLAACIGKDIVTFIPSKQPNSCHIVVAQLVNHGVSSSLLEKLNDEIEGFFKLPLEEKMKYKIRPGDVEGYGTVVRTDNQRLDWGDRVYMIINPLHRRKPYLFPELPSSLRFPLSLSLSLINLFFFS